MSSLGTNLIQVIKDKEFQAVTKDLTEVVIDSNIAEGLLKEGSVDETEKIAR